MSELERNVTTTPAHDEWRKDYPVTSQVTQWGVCFVWRDCLLGFVLPDGTVVHEPSFKCLVEDISDDGDTVAYDKHNNLVRINIRTAK